MVGEFALSFFVSPQKCLCGILKHKMWWTRKMEIMAKREMLLVGKQDRSLCGITAPTNRRIHICQVHWSL